MGEDSTNLLIMFKDSFWNVLKFVFKDIDFQLSSFTAK